MDYDAVFEEVKQLALERLAAGKPDRKVDPDSVDDLDDLYERARRARTRRDDGEAIRLLLDAKSRLDPVPDPPRPHASARSC